MKWILNKIPLNELTPHFVFDLKDHSEIWPVLQMSENWLLPIWKYLLCKLDWYAAIKKLLIPNFCEMELKELQVTQENFSVCLTW